MREEQEEQRGRDAPLFVYFLLTDFILGGIIFFLIEIIHIP